MTFEEILALIPEEKKVEVKAELAKLEGAIKIASREDADKLAKENAFVKSVVDAEISRAVLAHDTKFQTEKLPGLIEAKLREANPPKSPEAIEAAKLREDIEKLKRDNARDKQKVRVIGKLGELGLDPTMAELFIGETDQETDLKFTNTFVPAFEGARQRYTEAKMKEILGNGQIPQGGKPAAPVDLKAQFEKALTDGNADLALALQGKLQQQAAMFK